MTLTRRAFACAFAAAALLCLSAARADTEHDAFKPVVGQEGKDVVWVPTPPVLVEKMLDMAKVTPRDFVMDLGSGDGRNIIAAARRGARALGVEYNAKMVELATRTAQEQGVGERARFVQGDMYEADVSEATVLALFLLPENLRKLTPKFLDMKPGTRIVANHFGIDGWDADETGHTEGDCNAWCTALLYIVPAKVAGTWKIAGGEMTLEQRFQLATGSYTVGDKTLPVRNVKLKGDEISFSIGDADYTGQVAGDAMHGRVTGSTYGPWSATRGK